MRSYQHLKENINSVADTFMDDLAQNQQGDFAKIVDFKRVCTLAILEGFERLEERMEPKGIPEEANCGNCEYYKEMGNTGYRCIFNPPTIIMPTTPYEDSVFPRSYIDYVCGQWLHCETHKKEMP